MCGGIGDVVAERYRFYSFVRAYAFSLLLRAFTNVRNIHCYLKF